MCFRNEETSERLSPPLSRLTADCGAYTESCYLPSNENTVVTSWTLHPSWLFIAVNQDRNVVRKEI
jgi:hypothetical protein